MTNTARLHAPTLAERDPVMVQDQARDGWGRFAKVACVRAHDRCYLGGPCPWCEIKLPHIAMPADVTDAEQFPNIAAAVASLSPERRAELNAEWDCDPVGAPKVRVIGQ